jgi:DNA-binding transcriptional ArsR family regulator
MSLDATFAALSDPTRRAILAQLADGAFTVGALAEPFEISAPAISRHLRVLEEAGLIRREKDAQRRVIRLEPEALRDASEWIEQYRKFWEDKLDALASYLKDVQEKKHGRSKRTKRRR